MVGVMDVNGKLLKHYAQDFINHKRYVIVALQNQTDPSTCSVVDIDDLEPNIRAELVALVNSPECQMLKETYPILDKRFFLDYPNATMLKILQAMHKILVVKSDQVAIQLPGEQTITPTDLVKAINEYESKKAKNKVASFDPNAVDANDVDTTKVEKTSNDEEIQGIKEDIKNLNTQVNSLVSSLSALTAALTAQKETETTKKKK